MPDLWFYGRGADLYGPYSGWQVAELADTGVVLRTDTVWEDGAEDGVSADTVLHLFPPAPDLPSVPPLPPAPLPAAPSLRVSRPRRAVAGPGAVILGQDGVTVRFRKKCTVCGQEDRSTQTAAIGPGTTRSVFFCPKCRKRRTVEIHGR